MSFSVTILGCSSALPTSKRFTTAQVVNILERFFLVDCGEGTQIQLRKYKVRFSKINHILISHLHADHFLGLFGFIASLNLLGRQKPLFVIGPRQLEEIYHFFNRFLNYELRFELYFIPLDFRKRNVVYQDHEIVVESFPMKHRIPTCGFLFSEKEKVRNIKKNVVEDLALSIKDMISIKEGHDFTDEKGIVHRNETLTMPPKPLRSYAFCSDTLFRDRTIEYVKHVSLLYHEATFTKNMRKQARETYHSTSIDAGTVALRAEVSKLIIGHFSSRYKNLDQLLEETRSVFPETSLAEDGKVFSVEYNSEDEIIIEERIINPEG